jgi:hypothetical protein
MFSMFLRNKIKHNHYNRTCCMLPIYISSLFVHYFVDSVSPVSNGFGQVNKQYDFKGIWLEEVEIVSSQNTWLQNPCSFLEGFHYITPNNHILAQYSSNLTRKLKAHCGTQKTPKWRYSGSSGFEHWTE